MAGGIVPAKEINHVLNNPFGEDVVLQNHTYANPNRFFSHWMFYEYFNSIPLILQNYFDPIDSIYLSCAIVKTLIHFSIIIILSICISGSGKITNKDFLLAAVLITPLFQTNYYRMDIGIIDKSVTYTFFYALPFCLLMLYLFPFIYDLFHNRKTSANLIVKILRIPLALIICFSGPLNPGIILIFSFLFLFAIIRVKYIQSDKEKIVHRMTNALTKIQNKIWFYLLPIGMFSLYSLFIGRNDSIAITNTIPLSELYSRLPVGIYEQFIKNNGFQILLFILTINSIIIYKRFRNNQGKKILRVFKWIGIFSLIYVLLLPFGGFRDWRPNILRYDTSIPITISLMFAFGISTLFLIKNMVMKQKFLYLPMIFGVLFAFTIADKSQFDKNDCERAALKEISESKEKIVELDNNCTVLSWAKIKKAEDSELNAELLIIWGITDEKKLYFNK